MQEITEQELSQANQALWHKAAAAVRASNLDYAVSIIQALLVENPTFLEGRKLLRRIEIQQSGGAKKKSSFFGLNTSGLSSMKYQSSAKKDPAGTLVQLEKELTKDPQNEALNEVMFEIFAEMGLIESAAFALETVRSANNPETVKTLHKLADFYMGNDRAAAAAEVYTDILKHTPHDVAAIKGSKDATARASMKSQNWSEESDMKSLMRDRAQFEANEASTRSGMTRDQMVDRLNVLLATYGQDQNNLSVVKDIAGVYEKLEDWANSHAYYAWAFSLSNGDVALRSKAEAMKDRAADAEVRELQKAMEADPENAELKARFQELRLQRLQMQVEESKRRVDQNPTDSQLRFDLGYAMYHLGDFTGAIPHLQQATRNPHIRTKALIILARTFRAKNMFDLAIKQLSDAIADLQSMDATKKDALYEKGLIFEQMGNKDAAVECYKQIYEVDYSYLDVASRVESFYS